MREIWISGVDVDYPATIPAHVKFNIWYLTLPYWLGGKRISLFAKVLTDEGKVLQTWEEDIKPSWFWGTRTYDYNIIDVDETPSYQIQVGEMI